MAIKSDKFEAHCIEMAKIAVKVGAVMDLKNDALQACFATILISGDKHGVFLEPVPRDTKTPVIPPEPAAVVPSSEPAKSVETAAAEKDREAAEKADRQVEDMPRNSTPEIADGQRRTSFLAAIHSVRELLNKEGHVPPITPAGLNAAIAHQFPGKSQLGVLDLDELEQLVMFLSKKLDALREKKVKAATVTEDDDLGF